MKRPLLAIPLAAVLAGLLLFLWAKRPDRPLPDSPPRDPVAHETHDHGSEPAAAPKKPATNSPLPAPAGSLLLRVKGRGQPLPGADVLVMRQGEEARMRLQTGTDGSCLILRIPSGAYVVAVSHPRFLQGELHVSVAPELRASADLELKTGGRIFGRVTDRAGTPLPRTSVYLLDGESGFGTGPHLSAKTDENGGYEIPAVPPGEFGLRFKHEQFRPHERRGISIRTGAEEVEANAVLEVGSRIAGRVVDEQGTPLAGASVTFGNEGGGGVVKTDVDGRFAVYGLTDAPAGGSAALKGYGTAYRRGVPPNTGDVEFRLTRGGTLAGRLLTEPIPEHFTVALSRFDAQLGRPLRIHQKAFSASTSQGLFSVEDLAPGAYWVEVEAAGYEAAEQPQVTIASGQTSAGVTIRLNRK